MNSTIRKKIKVFACIIFFLIFTISVNAEDDTEIKFTVKDALGSLSKASSKAEYCKAGGCRTGSGTFGIRVTVVDGRTGIKIDGTNTIDYLHEKNSYGTGTISKLYKTAIVKKTSAGSVSIKKMSDIPEITFKKNGKTYYINDYWKMNKDRYVAPTLKFPNSWNPNFDNVITYFKNAGLEFSQYMNKLDGKNLDELAKELKNTLFGKILAAAKYTIDLPDCEAVEALKKVHIMIEPISTVTIGNQYAWWDGEPLKDEVINEIKKIGALNFYSLFQNPDLAKKLGISPDVIIEMEEIASKPQLVTEHGLTLRQRTMMNYYMKVIRDYNKMYNHVKQTPSTSKRFIGTPTELAALIRDERNKELFGFVSKDTPDDCTQYEKDKGTCWKCNTAVCGSVATHVGNIGKYMYMKNGLSGFYYDEGTGTPNSWGELISKKGYGLSAIQITSEKTGSCTSGCAINDNGKTLKNNPDPKEPRYCCTYSKDKWKEYDDEPSFKKTIGATEWYKNTCGSYCKIEKGSFTVPKDFKEADCCTYTNYGPDAATRKSNSGGYNNQKELEGSDVYKKNCVTPQPKCTASSVILSKNDPCCYQSNYNEPIKSDPDFEAWMLLNNSKGHAICFEKTITNVCNYTVSTDCPNCENKVGIGYVKDEISPPTGKDEWDCIYESTGMWRNNYYSKSYGYGGNNYCSIYCKEEIDINYPDGGFRVTNGTKITIGENMTWGPVKTDGTKTCRTDKINYAQFDKDFESTNARVGTTWTEYMKQLARHEKVTSSAIITTNSSCGCRYYATGSDPNGNYHSISCCNALGFTPYKYEVTIGSASCETIEETPTDPETGTVTTKEVCTCSSGRLSGKSCLEERTGYNSHCTAVNNTYNDSYSSVTYSYTSADGASLSGSEGPICVSRYSSGVSSAYSAYTSALSNRQATLTAINNCSKWEGTINYNDFKPEIRISYTDEVYSLTDEVLSTIQKGSMQVKYANSNGWHTVKPNDDKKIGYVCQNRSCSKKQDFAYPTSEYVEAEYNKKYSYILPSETFRYILKETNESLSYRPGTPNYVDVGYGNLPVSLSSKGEYEISLDLITLGNTNKLTDFIFGSKQSYLTGSCDNLYDCKYYVNEQVQITKKGLNVIYRPISLTNPFPGQSGTTRKRGSNWNNDTLVSNYITNNRGVKEYELYYKKAPLYVITLTPATILEIRNYNSNTQYSDYNLSCVNGEKCKSDFIRNSDFAKYFSGCRLNDSNSKCNKGEAW